MVGLDKIMSMELRVTKEEMTMDNKKLLVVMQPMRYENGRLKKEINTMKVKRDYEKLVSESRSTKAACPKSLEIQLQDMAKETEALISTDLIRTN